MLHYKIQVDFKIRITKLQRLRYTNIEGSWTSTSIDKHLRSVEIFRLEVSS